MLDRLEDRTAEMLDAVETLTGEMQDDLGEMSTWPLLQLREWLGEMRTALDRLDRAIAAAFPLAELQEQIAEQESADRFRAERERVAMAKAVKR